MTRQVTAVINKLSYRYSQFYMEDSFCHYNMFNHHFFDGKVRIMTIISFFYCISFIIFLGSLKSKWWLFYHLLIFIFVHSLSVYWAPRGDHVIHLSWLFTASWVKSDFLTKTHVAVCGLTPATLQPVLSLFLLCCSCSGHMTFISNWPFHHRGFCPCCSLHLLLSLCLVDVTSSFRTLFQVTFFSLPWPSDKVRFSFVDLLCCN